MSLRNLHTEYEIQRQIFGTKSISRTIHHHHDCKNFSMFNGNIIRPVSALLDIWYAHGMLTNTTKEGARHSHSDSLPREEMRENGNTYVIPKEKLSAVFLNPFFHSPSAFHCLNSANSTWKYLFLTCPIYTYTPQF